MERIVAVWTVGIEGAKSLKNEQRYNEAIANFESMQIVWLDESPIMKLHGLTEHW